MINEEDDGEFVVLGDSVYIKKKLESLKVGFVCFIGVFEDIVMVFNFFVILFDVKFVFNWDELLFYVDYFIILVLVMLYYNMNCGEGKVCISIWWDRFWFFFYLCDLVIVCFKLEDE